MSYHFTVAIIPEDGWFVAKCLNNSVASQGRSIEEAMENLKEAIQLYYEDNEKPELSETAYFTTLEVAF
ncbi:MAG: type II toxin-antitoxin system HicB family antitoxin [Oscillospiraceae bacterium]|jgi:predicted RNase H-like HicB family nuclease|nr:type II toxin-antitoxin system HicB family antitoxin [Oscillospiraceae bacterium]